MFIRASLFPIRKSFHYPLQTPSWYIGHMAKSMKDMAHLLRDINVVIEARDARLPLTSINPAFDDLLEKTWGAPKDLGVSTAIEGDANTEGAEGYRYDVYRGRERNKIVVYTKGDLAEVKYQDALKHAFQKHLRQKVFFTDTRKDTDVRQILKHIVQTAKANEENVMQTNVLVVGMPNVGKSSLLNALRRVGVNKGKAFRTGNLAGVTRKVTGTVKIYEDPPIYVYDTPGVMVPFLGHGDEGAERGIKYALTAGIKEDLLEREALVDYLLWRLNRRWLDDISHPGLTTPLSNWLQTLKLEKQLDSPTDDIYVFLDAVCDHYGFKKKGGGKDHDGAITYILHSFRTGKFGQWTLDDLGVSIDPLALENISPEIQYTGSSTPREVVPAQASPSGTDVTSPAVQTLEASTDSIPESESVPLENAREESSSVPLTKGGKTTPSSTVLPDNTKYIKQAVERAVKAHLDHSTRQRSEYAEGRGLSTNQQRKADAKARSEQRKERAKARIKAKGGGGGGGAGGRR